MNTGESDGRAKIVTLARGRGTATARAMFVTIFQTSSASWKVVARILKVVS
jgi:hypothetical protein